MLISRNDDELQNANAQGQKGQISTPASSNLQLKIIVPVKCQLVASTLSVYSAISKSKLIETVYTGPRVYTPCLYDYDQPTLNARVQRRVQLNINEL